MRESTSYTVHYTFYSPEQEVALRKFLDAESIHYTYVQIKLSHRLRFPVAVSAFIDRIEKHGGRVVRIVEDHHKSETNSIYYNSAAEWRGTNE